MAPDSSNVLLTTFPEHRSRNVGDCLITDSTLSLIRSRVPQFDPVILFREESLDSLNDEVVRNIIAPGFSVSNGTYPNLFRLYADLQRMPAFFPIGCSLQHPSAGASVASDYSYDRHTLNFLRWIASEFGPLPCRDHLIVDILSRHGISAVYSGDMALYDEKKIGLPFQPPAAMNSVVFTIPHHERFVRQAAGVLNAIVACASQARRYVAFHSLPNSHSRRVAELALALGFEELHLYGSACNLDIYDDIDLHIGYRLHGHIAFLRRRKASVLLVEDFRSYGFSQTWGTSVGCFNAFGCGSISEDEALPAEIIRFVNQQFDEEFDDYRRVFDSIDSTHAAFVKPYFDDLASRLC
ncbi:polysaccharide pyruvyl transferase family protein [Bordetella petrii]|uniref:Polysaccharide pyruvyl transferase domain-containing protein n=1 Tax=Bordetella petrii (strain ATCC BAA-461 / DSM 12804 / CCUG 43448 / CIP 107267 / Se-1111R) TaxID=340100 RepID=A9ILZ1_BORPD|nr:hypothetical protein Bpet2301 [Bordetella petrii]